MSRPGHLHTQACARKLPSQHTAPSDTLKIPRVHTYYALARQVPKRTRKLRLLRLRFYTTLHLHPYPYPKRIFSCDCGVRNGDDGGKGKGRCRHFTSHDLKTTLDPADR